MSRTKRREHRTFLVEIEVFRCDRCGREWETSGPDDATWAGRTPAQADSPLADRAVFTLMSHRLLPPGWIEIADGESRAHLCPDCRSDVDRFLLTGRSVP